MLDPIFDAYVHESPVSVMFRGTLENIFSPDRLDQIFRDNAENQVCGELLFSTCANLVGLVAARVRPSVNAAYRKMAGQIGVSVKSVYNKLNGIELAVSEAVVHDTAADLKAVIEAMNAAQPGPLPGHDVRIVDGNHLRGTDHRIEELRDIGDGALPGHTVAVLNPHVEVIERVIACEDGHANQRLMYPLLLDQVERGQVWIADRDYCTLDFLFGIKRQGGHFLIRQHGSMPYELIGRRKHIGETETGEVYEQKMRITHSDGQTVIVRRITLKLYEPTRDGDEEIHIVCSLPKKVSAIKIVEAYRCRWSIETAFAKLTTDLRCELNTLGYPKAALFSFCMAVAMYNVLNTVIAALHTAHPDVATSQSRSDGKEKTFSVYYLVDEIKGVQRGMMIGIPPQYWTSEFAALTPKQLAARLVWLARRVEVKQFLTNPYGKKIPKPKPEMTTSGGHVSTYEILQQRKKTSEKQVT